MSSIFTKIINGEIPSYKVYENDYVYAFLDIHPVQQWHTLIIPKIEIDHILDVEEPHYTAIWIATKKIGKAIQKFSGSKKIATLTLGMEVPHAHVHLIPINSESDIDFKNTKELSPEQMKEIQERIISYL